MRTLADVVFLAHATFTVAMPFAWLFLPWQWMAAVCGGIALSNALDGGRCPVTRLEFNLRRRVLPLKLISVANLKAYPMGAWITFDRAPYIVKWRKAVGAIGGVVGLQPYLPSESVMARLLRVTGIHATPEQVQRLMLALLVLLPLAAWVREVLV